MKFAYSAGGVVFKKVKGQVYILISKHSGYHKWVFPKGLIADSIKNESKEQTAVREVKEETGITARILKPLAPITYWFNFKGEKVKKTVYYFLMEYLSGDFQNHDFEMEEVNWFPMKEVNKMLAFSGDKKVFKEARTEIDNLLSEI